MLVLSRQREQVIVIGEGPNQIRITLVDIRGDAVRLGVTAPKAIEVHRLEVYEAKQRIARSGNRPDVIAAEAAALAKYEAVVTETATVKE